MIAERSRPCGHFDRDGGLEVRMLHWRASSPKRWISCGMRAPRRVRLCVIGQTGDTRARQSSGTHSPGS